MNAQPQKKQQAQDYSGTNPRTQDDKYSNQNTSKNPDASRRPGSSVEKDEAQSGAQAGRTGSSQGSSYSSSQGSNPRRDEEQD